MNLKTRVKELLISTTGYWFYKRKYLPVGCDLTNDLIYKLKLPLKTVFDVGANVGQTAVKFHQNLKESTIYSFEPFNNPFHQLENNTKHLKRVKCFKLALGDQIETKEIHVFEGKESVFNSLKKEAQNKDKNVVEAVEVVTGDYFCQEHGVNKIDLLKIDTEGFEIQVLQGFQNMLEASKIKALYCEVGFNRDNIRNTYINELMDFADKNSFTFYGLYEISNLQIKERRNYGNVLFLHNDVISDLP